MGQTEVDVDIDDSRYRITVSQQAAASCTGALITSLLVTPLDVVKIRLQAQQRAMQGTKCFLFCNGLMDHLCNCTSSQMQKQWFERNGHFTGTIDAFVKISKTEGLTSLWSGLSPTLVLAVPATIAYFVTYEQLRLGLKDYYNRRRSGNERFKQPLWIPLVSGAAARVLSVTVVSPLELIRTKMQSTKLSYFEVGDALKTVIKQDGIKGLWKGIFPTLLRDVPFSALYWAQYETLKKWYGQKTTSFWFSFVAGFISGGVASIITLPFDVVKTHQQIEIGEQHIYGGKLQENSSTWKMINRLYNQHGVRALFTGLVPRLIKVAPACAIMISTFEHGKIVFNRLGNSFNSSVIEMKGSVDEININVTSNVSISKDAKNIASKGLISEIVTNNKSDLL